MTAVLLVNIQNQHQLPMALLMIFLHDYILMYYYRFIFNNILRLFSTSRFPSYLKKASINSSVDILQCFSMPLLFGTRFNSFLVN